MDSVTVFLATISPWMTVLAITGEGVIVWVGWKLILLASRLSQQTRAFDRLPVRLETMDTRLLAIEALVRAMQGYAGEITAIDRRMRDVEDLLREQRLALSTVTTTTGKELSQLTTITAKLDAMDTRMTSLEQHAYHVDALRTAHDQLALRVQRLEATIERLAHTGGSTEPLGGVIDDRGPAA